MPDRDKDELLRQLGDAMRRMGAQSVLSSAAMAKHFGLHPTDLEVLDLIFLRETVTAGALAAATGLTSGSVTALVDRLVARGYVARRRDEADRRRVLISVERAATAPIEAAYEPRRIAMQALWSSFDHETLHLVTDFLTRSTDLLVRSTEEIVAADSARVRGTAAPS
ncbi:MarR family transcriptional regulator [Bosea sp. (in: a-proteobacteria)]|uniref:MarR family transcriptional regulator n=1 Tax=Bosea sp. (in: a-proteobacteria) TaxID=1871050 RepID=UPI001AD4BD30|nr:MarR family transcriptional regulator [Bosea sp. (in: a-proteobacteria)]MBN9440850.1 MarR family transcriptional regulator [Bosea sp. (in: a-proteobacteria)]